jgi:hypothetical protein
MVNEIQVRHGNQPSNKSQKQLRRVNKALMYVLKELGAASRRLMTAASFFRQQIASVGRRHSELRNVRLVIGCGRQRARRQNYGACTAPYVTYKMKSTASEVELDRAATNKHC